MAHVAKKYKAAVAKVDRTKRYKLEEAMGLVKQTATKKFDETVDAAINLGVDPKHADQVVRGAVVLPHGMGKSVKIAVFAKGDKAKEAQEAGADVVGAEDLVAKIQEGWLDFEVAIAAPDMMPKISRLGRVLGPKGLMPSPKSGTVTPNVAQAVKEFKVGRIEYRTDAQGNVHAPVGKLSFSNEDLKANIQAFIDHIRSARPSSAKGQYMKSVTLASTMGPGIRLAVQ